MDTKQRHSQRVALQANIRCHELRSAVDTIHLASTKLWIHCKCFRCTTNPATIVNEPPEVDVANLDDIVEELVQTAEESDRLTREEQDVLDEDLSTPSPNPALLPDLHIENDGTAEISISRCTCRRSQLLLEVGHKALRGDVGCRTND